MAVFIQKHDRHLAFLTAGIPRRDRGFLPVRLFDAVYVNNAKAFLILNPHRAR